MTTEMINLHSLMRKLNQLEEDRQDGVYYVRIFSDGDMELVVTKWETMEDQDVFEAVTFEDFNQQLDAYIDEQV